LLQAAAIDRRLDTFQDCGCDDCEIHSTARQLAANVLTGVSSHNTGDSQQRHCAVMYKAENFNLFKIDARQAGAVDGAAINELCRPATELNQSLLMSHSVTLWILRCCETPRLIDDLGMHGIVINFAIERTSREYPACRNKLAKNQSNDLRYGLLDFDGPGATHRAGGSLGSGAIGWACRLSTRASLGARS